VGDEEAEAAGSERARLLGGMGVEFAPAPGRIPILVVGVGVQHRMGGHPLPPFYGILCYFLAESVHHCRPLAVKVTGFSVPVQSASSREEYRDTWTEIILRGSSVT
jgi:hypothetical protein